MKIFYVTSSSNLSGGSRQALYTAQGLAARGHELTFFAPHDARLPELAPEMQWSPLPRSRRRWGAAIACKLPASGPFVVHAFHNKAVKMAAWQGLFWRRKGAAMFAQRGVVYKPNNPLPYWSPGIDCFMVNSEACASVLRAKGVRCSRLRVVYNGIPEERIRPLRPAAEMLQQLSLNQNDFIFGCVANDSANKGAELLLQALAQARLPNSRLILAGVTPEKFAPVVEELGLEAQVRLPGQCPHPADYLQLCQAFVLPSLSESMPNTLQEAICMGLPVAATAVGGVPECILGNGLLLPPGDVQEIAAALQRLANNTTQLEKWAAGSRSLATLFSMQRKVNRVETIYNEMLRGRGLRIKGAA